MRILKDLFNCKFSSLPYRVLKSFWTFHFSSGYTKKCIVAFSDNMKKKRLKTFKERQEKCLSHWKRKCLEANVQVVKTIRLSTTLVKSLVEAVPGLKIVHLIRDPRGIINSRVNIGEISATRNISQYLEHVCTTMRHDIESVLSSKYLAAGRIIPLSFEHVAENPFAVAEILFDKLGIPFTKDTKNWLYKYASHSSTRRKKKGSFNVQKIDSKVIAHAWREQMPKDFLKRVEKICSPLINLLEKTKYGNIILDNM